MLPFDINFESRVERNNQTKYLNKRTSKFISWKKFHGRLSRKTIKKIKRTR